MRSAAIFENWVKRMDKQIHLGERSILRYFECPDGIHVTEYQGNEQKVKIPDSIEHIPVTAVGRKAFLNNRMLHTVQVPEEVRSVGDWAFANCPSLETVILPKEEIVFGRNVFSRSHRLKRIFLYTNGNVRKDRQGQEETAALLAASSRILQADYLLKPLEAGSEAWLRSFDERMFTVFEQKEEEALRDLVFCAEEDIEEKQEVFLKEWRKRKAELAYFRLAYPGGLSGVAKEFLQKYILERTKGCGSESAWDVLKEGGEDQIQYAKILLEAGGVNDLNFTNMLADLGEHHTELKAYLLKWKSDLGSDERAECFWKTNFSI